MSDLRAIDEKLGEVLGLAMAAQQATSKIGTMVEDEQVGATLQQMNDDAAETERRVDKLVATLDGRKTKIHDQARETKSEAVEMMKTYLGDDADGLDGLEFLTMAEAGEYGHWKVVDALNEELGDERLQELVDWALPIQRQHLELTLDGSVTLARQEDPVATA